MTPGILLGTAASQFPAVISGVMLCDIMMLFWLLMQGAVRSADERAAELKESGAAAAARADAAAADAVRASQVIDKLSVSCCPTHG